jgi:HD-GYP domain-containing protein (c-di-GMP phosphodiesterase class II)
MSDVATANDQVTNTLAGFVPVRRTTLRASRVNVVDLFIQYERGAEPRLYCRAGSHPTDEQISELEAAHIQNLYVRSGDFNTFSNDLFASLDTLLRQPQLPPNEKFAALQLAAAAALEQALRLVDCSKFRALAEKISGDLVALLGDRDVLPRELFRLARHDFNAFTHITNVASYAVILAQKLGITDHNVLRKIASAAMLHDLGKRFIPARILTKSERLTTEEREIIESHPLRGYVDLAEQSDLEFGQLMMVYQHHERVDGTGYPVRIRKEEIHPWARMLAVVDVFDTMTAKRPDHRPESPERVLEYQRQQAGTRFDGEYVECWISAMTKA